MTRDDFIKLHRPVVRESALQGRQILTSPHQVSRLVGGEDKRVSGYSDRPAFDLRVEVPPVGPLEYVAEADVSFADVVEEDDLFPSVAVPPDGTFACTERLETIPEVMGCPRLTTTRRSPPVVDALRSAPHCADRVQ